MYEILLVIYLLFLLIRRLYHDIKLRFLYLFSYFSISIYKTLLRYKRTIIVFVENPM